MHAKWQTNQATKRPTDHARLAVHPPLPLLTPPAGVIQPGKRSQAELTSRGIAYDGLALLIFVT